MTTEAAPAPQPAAAAPAAPAAPATTTEPASTPAPAVSSLSVSWNRVNADALKVTDCPGRRSCSSRRRQEGIHRFYKKVKKAIQGLTVRSQVFVGNLAFKTSEESLRQIFEGQGTM